MSIVYKIYVLLPPNQVSSLKQIHLEDHSDYHPSKYPELLGILMFHDSTVPVAVAAAVAIQ